MEIHLKEFKIYAVKLIYGRNNIIIKIYYINKLNVRIDNIMFKINY